MLEMKNKNYLTILEFQINCSEERNDRWPEGMKGYLQEAKEVSCHSLLPCILRIRNKCVLARTTYL